MNKNDPIIVSIEGNIGVGKSTLLEKLQDLPNVFVLPEPCSTWTAMSSEKINMLELFYTNPHEHAFAFQTLTLTTRYQSFMDLINQSSFQQCSSRPIIVCERSLHSDHGVFAQMLKNSNHISEPHFAINKLLFQTLSQSFSLDYIIHLQLSETECLSRITKRNRIGEEGLVSLDYLTLLNAQTFKWIRETNVPLLEVQCNHSSEQVAAEVIGFLKSIQATS